MGRENEHPDLDSCGLHLKRAVGWPRDGTAEGTSDSDNGKEVRILAQGYYAKKGRAGSIRIYFTGQTTWIQLSWFGNPYRYSSGKGDPTSLYARQSGYFSFPL